MNNKNNSKKYLKPDIKVYDIQPCAIIAESPSGASINVDNFKTEEGTGARQSAEYRTSIWN